MTVLVNLLVKGQTRLIVAYIVNTNYTVLSFYFVFIKAESVVNQNNVSL